jgi:hypothetical protein
MPIGIFYGHFGIVCSHLVHFPVLVYLNQEKSGNPGVRIIHSELLRLIYAGTYIGMHFTIPVLTA